LELATPSNRRSIKPPRADSPVPQLLVAGDAVALWHAVFALPRRAIGRPFSEDGLVLQPVCTGVTSE
jgi:hypothetical protein